MLKIITALELQEGATCPRGYGLAYRDFLCDKTIWYPIGIHLIAGWFHKFKDWWMKYICIPNWYPSQLDWHIIKKVRAEREKIDKQGYERGYRLGQESMKRYCEQLIFGE